MRGGGLEVNEFMNKSPVMATKCDQPGGGGRGYPVQRGPTSEGPGEV